MKIQAFLPLVTYPDANTDSVAPNAVDVAVQLGAHLHAAPLVVDIPPVTSALSRVLLDVPQMIREAKEVSRANGDRLVSEVVVEANRREVPVSVESVTAALALIGDAAAENARYFDLVLFGWEAGNDTVQMVAEALVFGSGHPVLLMPGSAGMKRIQRVAIAWDGSRVAARAVADALPFLSLASRIDVLSVLDEKPLSERSGNERLADALRKRGLDAASVSINAENRPIGETLQDHAARKGNDLLVMGAFGHSRVRDFVLGGATAGVLDDLRMPVLFSH